MPAKPITPEKSLCAYPQNLFTGSEEILKKLRLRPLPNYPSLKSSEKMFKLGCNYTRTEIHAQLGGSVVSCLPTRDGMIVAACLSTKFSPQAPGVVLCGKGARTSAVSALLARQQTALPVFTKSASGRWQYRGQFLVDQSYVSGVEFESFIHGSGRSVASVSYVVVLKAV